MPKKLVWTEAQDLQIRRMRAEGHSWDQIADRMDMNRWTVIERGRRIGARLPPPGSTPAPADPERPAMQAGDPVSWGAITEGTVLAGRVYVRAPVRR